MKKDLKRNSIILHLHLSCTKILGTGFRLLNPCHPCPASHRGVFFPPPCPACSDPSGHSRLWEPGGALSVRAPPASPRGRQGVNGRVWEEHMMCELIPASSCGDLRTASSHPCLHTVGPHCVMEWRRRGALQLLQPWLLQVPMVSWISMFQRRFLPALNCLLY